jgi:type II secretory pathway predicted ATPase ExeA
MAAMFETFYGLSRTPFSRDIPTDQLYHSQMMDETLGRLEYAAERQLFAVITGDCGSGKTTVIRRFKDVLDASKYQVMYLADSDNSTPFLQGSFGTIGL